MVDEPKRVSRKWVFFPKGGEDDGTEEFKRRLVEAANNHPVGTDAESDDPKHPLHLIPGPGRELTDEDAERMAQALVESLPSEAFEKLAKKPSQESKDKDAAE